MPRIDKSLKAKQGYICKLKKEEKAALNAISHCPKFPNKLVNLKKKH